MSLFVKTVDRILNMWERNIVISEKQLAMEQEHHKKVMSRGAQPLPQAEPCCPQERPETVETTITGNIAEDQDVGINTLTCGDSGVVEKTLLEQLRDKCDTLGIPYALKNKTFTLEKKIAKFMGDEAAKESPSNPAPSQTPEEELVTIEDCRKVLAAFHDPPARDGEKLILEVTGKKSLGEIDALEDKALASGLFSSLIEKAHSIIETGGSS